MGQAISAARDEVKEIDKTAEDKAKQDLEILEKMVDNVLDKYEANLNAWVYPSHLQFIARIWCFCQIGNFLVLTQRRRHKFQESVQFDRPDFQLLRSKTRYNCLFQGVTSAAYFHSTSHLTTDSSSLLASSRGQQSYWQFLQYRPEQWIWGREKGRRYERQVTQRLQGTSETSRIPREKCLLLYWDSVNRQHSLERFLG